MEHVCASVSESPRITMQHIRDAGFCVSGTRAFCAQHGLDFRALVRDGIDIDAVRATNDAMALAVIAHAQSEQVKVNG